MKKILFALYVCASPALLMADIENAPAQGQSIMQTVVMIGIALLFFYVILWRPEQKRRKQMLEQRANLRVGDKVTAMGIVGTVDQIKENTIVLENIDGSKIEILSAAISDVSAPEKQMMETESTVD